MGNWYCTFHYPSDWIEVVHPQGEASANGGVDRVEARVQEAVERTFPDEPAARHLELAKAVAAQATHDVERSAALSAHGFKDDQGRAVDMHLTVWIEQRCHPESVDDELNLLADTIREAGVNMTSPEVSDVSLPAGPALRVRQLENVSREPSGPAEVVDAVDYWIPVEGSEEMLWVHIRTSDLAKADSVIPLFDRIADALVLET